MIDTHTHIYTSEFDEDRLDVLQRAQAAGVEHLLLPNINEDTVDPMLELTSLDALHLHPMLGLHPEDVREDYVDVLQRLEQRLTEGHPFVAIGEIGLDLYWDTTYEEQQLQAFRLQLQWASHHDLPVVIHCRSAHQHLVREMQPYAHLRGIFHCFGGSEEEAAELLAFPHFMLGIGGVVTFKKSKLPAILSQIVPLSRIVLETDAPYLAPTPHRGKRNEPSFLPHVAQCLAQAYGVDVKTIDEVTTCNAQHVFSNILLRKNVV